MISVAESLQNELSVFIFEPGVIDKIGKVSKNPRPKIKCLDRTKVHILLYFAANIGRYFSRSEYAKNSIPKKSGITIGKPLGK